MKDTNKSQAKTVKTQFGYSIRVGGLRNVGTKVNKNNNMEALKKIEDKFLAIDADKGTLRAYNSEDVTEVSEKILKKFFKKFEGKKEVKLSDQYINSLIVKFKKELINTLIIGYEQKLIH